MTVKMRMTRTVVMTAMMTTIVTKEKTIMKLTVIWKNAPVLWLKQGIKREGKRDERKNKIITIGMMILQILNTTKQKAKNAKHQKHNNNITDKTKTSQDNIGNTKRKRDDHFNSAATAALWQRACDPRIRIGGGLACL